MYVPLFAAISAQNQKGRETCPQLLALDEAFAGVDNQNISAMFELMRILDFDYIINSQALWGCYACVPDSFARPFSPPLQSQAVQFEAVLQQTSFQGVSLKEVEFYSYTEIRTRNGLREEENRCFSAMPIQASEQADNDTCRRWL